ncbi:MAG: YceI family protein [Ktedonobacteraceae bacterium]
MAWNIDPTHSQVTFSVKHMVVSTVRGNFKVFRGKMEIDEANPANSWVEAEAEISSIDTREPNRDKHLRSSDFFDAETYPTITFKSKVVEPISNDEFRVLGDLTIHGVTKEVLFNTEYSGQVRDAYGKQRAGLVAKASINRRDFGLNWNAPLEAGGVVVSEKVNIEIDLAAVKAD